MAIHHLTPPIRGGERPRLPTTQIGPVTQAIRVMRATELTETETVSVLPGDPDRERIRELRRRIAERIKADIALLDALDGDAEPSLGSIDATSHSERMGQDLWSIGGGQDREAGDDNGLGDHDALIEQGFSGYGRCA